MRMHRGSSKGAGDDLAPESLPLSAPLRDIAGDRATVRITVDRVRAGRSTTTTVDVPTGATVRVAVRLSGLSPEGCAVLIGDRPVPLDLPLDAPTRLTVVATFSGG